MKAIEAIVVAIIVIVVMAIIVSLLNRDDGNEEGFWRLKERDVFHVLCFGAAMSLMILVSGVWIHIESVFWASVVRTLPWIVIIVAIWVYTDNRLSQGRDVHERDDEPQDDEDVVYPWDEYDEDHVTWPWDEE